MAKAKVTQIKMVGPVEIHGQAALVTSMAVAEGCGVQHKNVLALVKKYGEHFSKLGEVAFQTRLNPQGSPTEIAVFNEDHATFCITLLRNTAKVLEFKLRLVQAFRQALNEIHRLYADPPRRDVLADKRAAHHPMMDALKDLRELQGKETEAHHFWCENKLCNGIVTGDFKKIDEKALSNEDAALLAKVRRRNESMLHVGFEYAERKKLLAQYAIRERTKRIAAPAPAPQLPALETSH